MGDTKIEVEAKNLLICKYLGVEPGAEGEYFLPQHGYKNGQGKWVDTFKASNLKFHKRWNWIMPVVLLIAKQHQTSFYMEDPAYIGSASNPDKYMFSIGEDTIFSTYKYEESPIRATFETIVDFIDKKNKFLK